MQTKFAKFFWKFLKKWLNLLDGSANLRSVNFVSQNSIIARSLRSPQISRFVGAARKKSLNQTNLKNF